MQHDGQGGSHADQNAEPVKGGGVLGKKDHHHCQSDHLQNEGEPHEYRAVEQNIQQLFHGKITYLRRRSRFQISFVREQEIRPSFNRIIP